MKKSGFRTSFKMVATLVFGLFLASVLSLVAYIYIQYQKNQRANKAFMQIYLPSYTQLVDFKTKVNSSEAYLEKWLYNDRDTSSSSYKSLLRLHRDEYYEFKREMWAAVDNWSKEQQNLYYQILQNLDSLFIKQKILLNNFQSPEDFNNTQLVFNSYAKVNKGGEIYETYYYTINLFDELIKLLEKDISVYTNKQSASYLRIKRLTLIYGFFVLFVFLIIAISLVRNVDNKIRRIISYLDELRKGRLPDVSMDTRLIEYRKIYRRINDVKKGLQAAGKFAIDISNNKFDTPFEPLSKEDVLGNALLILRDNLKRAQKEADMRKIENQQRQWASQGITEFSDLLRKHSGDIQDLTKHVVSKLVNFTVADIAGLYIVNEIDRKTLEKYERRYGNSAVVSEEDYKKNIKEDEKLDAKGDEKVTVLELIAYYAFDRHKFKKHIVKPGETLIGECYKDKQIIYLDNLPDDYIKITSGLGSDKPRSLLIVPLIINEEVVGVVELASFQVFKEYQQEFVLKIGEAIASAIATVKMNERTQQLLEESRKQAEKLKAKEKEARTEVNRLEGIIKQLRKELEQEQIKVRKLIQDLQRTENRMKKREMELEEQLFNKQRYIDQLMLAINNTIGYYELNPGGDFIEVNSLYLKMLSLSREQLIGTKHQMLISREFINSGAYKRIWDELKQGKVVNITIQYLVEGKFKYVNEVYTPILDGKGELQRVLVFSYVR